MERKNRIDTRIKNIPRKTLAFLFPILAKRRYNPKTNPLIVPSPARRYKKEFVSIFFKNVYQ